MANKKPEEQVLPEELPDNVKQYIASLEEQVKQRNDELEAIKKSEEGYLIWTPVANYDGPTASVMFKNGMAFIRSNRIFKDGGRTLTAEQMCQYLKSDFGYQYEFFGFDRLTELEKRMQARNAERNELDEKLGATRDMILEHALKTPSVL